MSQEEEEKAREKEGKTHTHIKTPKIPFLVSCKPKLKIEFHKMGLSSNNMIFPSVTFHEQLAVEIYSLHMRAEKEQTAGFTKPQGKSTNPNKSKSILLKSTNNINNAKTLQYLQMKRSAVNPIQQYQNTTIYEQLDPKSQQN